MSEVLHLHRFRESRQPDRGKRKRLQDDIIPYQIIHTDESPYAVNHTNLITAIDNTLKKQYLGNKITIQLFLMQ